MALIIEKTTDTGISASYWVIKEAHFSLRQPPNSLVILVDGYVDRDKRLEGFSPIQTLEVKVDGAGNVLGESATPNIIRGFYSILNRQEGWEEATSDEEEIPIPPVEETSSSISES